MEQLEKNLFTNFATIENNEKWENSITRISPLSHKPFDIRSEFDRDNTRILHSSAYYTARVLSVPRLCIQTQETSSFPSFPSCLATSG